MHGTLQLKELVAARQRSIRAKTIALVALAVIAGVAAGAAVVYMPAVDDLLLFFGFTDPKDCG